MANWTTKVTGDIIAADHINKIQKHISWVVPEDYGAVGDGVTDDTAAIQAAINAAEALGTADGLGGTVVFSNKKYITTSALTVDDDYVSLMGIGGGGIIKNTGTGAAVILSSCDHIKIKNLSIWGDGGAYGAGATGTYGVELNASRFISFDTVDIRYHGSHGIYGHGGIWGVSVVNTTIQQNAGDGINLNSPSGLATDQNGNNTSAINSKIFNNAGSGISWRAAGLNVSGTILEANKVAGILCDCTGSTLSGYGLNITGNYFESNWLGQIKFVTITGYTIFGAEISGNYLYSNYEGVGGATALIVSGGGTSSIANIHIGANSYNITGSVLTHWVDLSNYAATSCSIELLNNPTLFANLGLANGTVTARTICGGPNWSGNLTLSSTSNATKGNLIFGSSVFQETPSNLGIGQSTFGTSATKTLSLSTGVAPTTSPADSFQLYSADAGAVAGQAGPHFRTEGGGVFGMRSDTGTTLQYVYQADALADDGTVSLPDATSGMVLVSCNAEAGMWLVQADGTCTKISGSTNTAAADTDSNLCVYDGGTGAIVKNRLGATGEIRVVYYYN